MDLVAILKNLKKIPRSNEYSYYPEKEQKSHFRITMDNFSWFLKNKDVNNNYYLYGCDIKGQDPNDFLPYGKAKDIREKQNGQYNGIDYRSLLRDKFIFGQFMKSIHQPTPTNYFLGSLTDMKQLTPLPEGKVKAFCKDFTGLGGAGVFPIELDGDKVYIDGEAKSFSDLQQIMDGQFIIQEKIDQVEKMNELYPNAINAIRLLTVKDGEEVRVACGFIKIGANGSSIDNWASGGITVKINVGEGKLENYGYFKDVKKGKVTHHPNTDAQLNGFEIPYYKEACEVVMDLHQYFYGIRSIGWDVALTPNGPTILEGNDDWDISMIQKYFREELFNILGVDN